MEGIADYTGLRPYRHGGGSTTFRAAPPARLGLCAPVVLTVLDGVLEPEQLRRVTEEVQLFAAVDSPFVLRLLDAGHDDRRFFYAVEDLERGTLAEPADDLARSGALKVVADAARGAHALHEAGIAHGAISPARVVLHDEGAKLGEVGLSRLLRPGVTVPAGTPAVAAECTEPAVVRGERADRACDIWSLGATLHRAVSGRSVYGEELPPSDQLGALLRVLSTRPAVADGVEPEVATIVLACLEPDPDDRPQTAQAVAELVEDLL